MNPIEVMVTSNLPAAFITGIQRRFTVHHREHIRDPAVLARIRAVIASEKIPLGRDLFGLLPQLQLICVLGDDASQVDQATALQRGVLVLQTNDVHSQDMADFAMGLLIGSVRRIGQSERVLRNGDWADGPFPATGRVHGRRLGLVGYGPVGRAVAQRAQGFGMTVAYADVQPDASAPHAFYPQTLALAQQSDFLMLLLPKAVKACGTVDESVLQALGPQGHLVNLLAGPGLVDEAALIAALQAKKIGGVALDGFPDAPRVNPVYRQAQNTLLTPEMAQNTQGAIQDACDQVTLQLQTFFESLGT